jgi:hypothetical protein
MSLVRGSPPAAGLEVSQRGEGLACRRATEGGGGDESRAIAERVEVWLDQVDTRPTDEGRAEDGFLGPLQRQPKGVKHQMVG